jgi:hypothetical protein
MKDFTKSCAGQDQETDCRDRKGVEDDAAIILLGGVLCFRSTLIDRIRQARKYVKGTVIKFIMRGSWVRNPSYGTNKINKLLEKHKPKHSTEITGTTFWAGIPSKTVPWAILLRLSLISLLRAYHGNRN